VSSEKIHTRIWLEEPEPDNPFATRAAYCRGYDVYGEMLGRTSWIQMLYLLFHDEAPTPLQAKLLETLAVSIANPGPRNPAVHAAMCGGIGGSTAASCLMAALAVGAGNTGGAREVFTAMQGWSACGNDVEAWHQWIASVTQAVSAEVWRVPEHPPGFDPHGISGETIVLQTLITLAHSSPGLHLPWLAANRDALERAAHRPIALTGVAAAAFTDLGFTPEQGEMLFLLLRLPGAAAHALEQRGFKYKQFPFFALELENDPGVGARPAESP
jgi:citrate synthase